jgi:hypothetical protein
MASSTPKQEPSTTMSLSPSTRTRRLAAAAATLGMLAAPAGALAASSHPTADYLPAMGKGAKSPVAIHGGSAKAYVHTGGKLHTGQHLLPVKVSGKAHQGIKLHLTCPSGAITGWGYKGPDAFALNGHPFVGQHSLHVKVQAASDMNHDGRFTGTVYAFCEGGR